MDFFLAALFDNNVCISDLICSGLLSPYLIYLKVTIEMLMVSANWS